MDHTDEEGHAFARQRKPKSDPLCCPICGVTLRSNEIDQHFALEVERLDRILKPKRNPHSIGGYGTADRASPAVPGTSAVAGGSRNAGLANGHRAMEDNNSDVASNCNADECWGTYQKIKNNRQARLKVCTGLCVSCNF